MTSSTAPRNVLLISLDDCVAFWKYKFIFGDELQTPNLDLISAQSTIFQSAYCQTPVCSPSRASFMTSKSPHQIDVLKSDKHYINRLDPEMFWLHTLKQRGYFCSSGGKVIQGYRPLPADLHKTFFSDEAKVFSLWRRDRRLRSGRARSSVAETTYGGFRGGPATVEKKDDARYYDHQVAVSARRFLQHYDGDAPFYREVGFSGPHGPWKTPAHYKERYDPGKLQQPADWANGFDPSPFMEATTPESFDRNNLAFWQASVRNYFSALTHVDHHVGRVWRSLKKSPYADDTLVILLSDHGMHMGERNMFRKHTLWEQVAAVPLIIHDPRAPVGQVVDDPVGLVDVGPTIMDYLDLPPLKDTPGQSLRPQVEQNRNPDRVVPTFYDESAAVRTGKYRFIRYADSSTEFFDLSQDWWQTRNLGPDHHDFPDAQAAFSACMHEYSASRLA